MEMEIVCGCSLKTSINACSDVVTMNAYSDSDELLYHGTSMQRAERILLEGFRITEADHDIALLEDLISHLEYVDGSPETVARIHGLVQGRIHAKECFKLQMSFVDDFGWARIWAKENHTCNEMHSSLLSLYDHIVDLLPSSEYNDIWRTRIGEARQDLLACVSPADPAVITVDIDAAKLIKRGMSVMLPSDGSFLNSIREYHEKGRKHERDAVNAFIRTQTGVEDISTLDFMVWRELAGAFQSTGTYRPSYEFRCEYDLPPDIIVRVDEV